MSVPSLDNLRCFLAAARLLRFREAARSVALTPAAFGQRIKQLEDQVGAALFARTTRKVRLTEAGLALLPYAERCLATLDEGVRAARGEIGPPPQDLVLGTRHELGMSWIVPQLGALAAERPYLNLHLYFGAAHDLHRKVHALEIDCAVTSARSDDPKLDSVRLHREDYVLVGAASLFAEAPLDRPDHARAHTLLDIAPDLPLFRYLRDGKDGDGRLHFGKHTYLGTTAAIHRRVLDGAGVAVLPAYLVAKSLASGKLVKALPTVALRYDHFRLVFRADDTRRPLFESLGASLAKVPLA
jgi:LysR family glycine cleavage system transcriptional activator